MTPRPASYSARGGPSSFVMHRNPSASVPLAERIGHTSPSKFETRDHIHGGAGSMAFSTLLDSDALSANLFFVHRGVLHPGGGIGHHFHNVCEEMYLIFDNEAEFTVDGRTSRLEGPVGVPSRLGHSHAIFNRSERPTEWMNINVSLAKDTYDCFDLDDDRVDAEIDPKPVFMSVRLEESGVSESSTPVRIRRLIAPGVFLGPWRFLDHAVVSPGSSYAESADTEVERFAYVLRGEGHAQVADGEAPVESGDAVPLLHGEPFAFTGTGDGALELMLVGIAID